MCVTDEYEVRLGDCRLGESNRRESGEAIGKISVKEESKTVH